MKPYTTYIDIIQDSYPDFVVHSIAPCNAGQHALSFTINDAYIFRFPRYEVEWSSFDEERKLLERLHGRLPLPTPKPEYGRESEFGTQPFMGYRRLPGTPLRRDFVAALRGDAREKVLAAQLGNFLAVLHAPKTARIVDTGGSSLDTRRRYASLLKEIQEKLFPHMRREKQRETNDLFKAFLDDDHHFAYTPCLRHGDFGPTNILVADDHRTITAILDFGEAGLGDPAYDFAGVLCYGADFMERVGASYPGFEGLRGRAAFYNATFGIQEALFGLNHDDKEAFESGMSGLG